MYTVWCQQWEESESGWGIRPDGYSLHLHLQHALEYVVNFMEEQEEYFISKGITGVPNEYSRKAGHPYAVSIEKEKWEELKEAEEELGVRYLSNDWPKPNDDKLTTSWGKVQPKPRAKTKIRKS